MDVNDVIDAIKSGEGVRVEFKRRFSKEGFAETVCAMLNTEGGVVLIGVDDSGRVIGVEDPGIVEKVTAALQAIQPPPEVGIEKFRLDDRVICVVRVPKSDKLHSYRGRVFVRLGASNRPLSVMEIVERAAESLFVYFDHLPSSAPLDAINEEYVEEYLRRREEVRGVARRGDLMENMVRLRIVVRKGSGYVPTNGGLLFFSDAADEYFPNSRVRLVWFKDEEMREYSDSREFGGPLWKVVDEIYEYFVRNLKRVGGEVVGWRRVEVFEYPLRALREAVINALIHRNYFDPGQVQIFIFPSRIVIRNPGGFPPGVTVDEPLHKPRNPLLAQYMYDIGYIEKYGIGIKLIREECERHPLVSVEFRTRPFYTEVVFHKREAAILDELDRRIVEVLERKGSMMSSEIASELGVSKPTVLKRLRKLISLGLVREEGRGARRRYRVARH
ncbi:MAG: RNA-binding domain-containing protein [Candidatus Baldrarchaeia archaeon]